jgi:hypothetical protein
LQAKPAGNQSPAAACLGPRHWRQRATDPGHWRRGLQFDALQYPSPAKPPRKRFKLTSAQATADARSAGDSTRASTAPTPPAVQTAFQLWPAVAHQWRVLKKSGSLPLAWSSTGSGFRIPARHRLSPTSPTQPVPADDHPGAACMKKIARKWEND